MNPLAQKEQTLPGLSLDAHFLYVLVYISILESFTTVRAHTFLVSVNIFHVNTEAFSDVWTVQARTDIAYLAKRTVLT